MDQMDMDMVVAKLREIHALINGSFGLRGGLGAVLVMDRDLVTLYGIDSDDVDMVRTFKPSEIIEGEEVRFGGAILRGDAFVKTFQLTISNKSRALAPGVHAIGCTAEEV